MSATVIACYMFASSTNGCVIYQTLQYSNGSLSCECPGWTRRSIRMCKHTRMVEQGLGERMAVSFKRYGNPAPPTRNANIFVEAGRKLDLS